MKSTKLKALRRRYGFTALRLAQAAGTTETRIFQIERDRFRPRNEEANEIARVLGVTPADLFPGGVQSPDMERVNGGDL